MTNLAKHFQNPNGFEMCRIFHNCIVTVANYLHVYGDAALCAHSACMQQCEQLLVRLNSTLCDLTQRRAVVLTNVLTVIRALAMLFYSFHPTRPELKEAVNMCTITPCLLKMMVNDADVRTDKLDLYTLALVATTPVPQPPPHVAPVVFKYAVLAADAKVELLRA